MEIEIIYVASRIVDEIKDVPTTSLKILFLDKTNLDFYEKENLISSEFIQDIVSGYRIINDYKIDDRIYEEIKKSGEKPVSLEYIYKNYSPEMLKNVLPYLRDMKLSNLTK